MKDKHGKEKLTQGEGFFIVICLIVAVVAGLYATSTVLI